MSMTNEEAIERVKTMRWEHATNKDNPDHEAMTMAIEALKQKSILHKIFCIAHPLSIMSTPELEHKAIMHIAEMLEPLCLPESEDKE